MKEVVGLAEKILKVLSQSLYNSLFFSLIVFSAISSDQSGLGYCEQQTSGMSTVINNNFSDCKKRKENFYFNKNINYLFICIFKMCRVLCLSLSDRFLLLAIAQKKAVIIKLTFFFALAPLSNDQFIAAAHQIGKLLLNCMAHSFHCVAFSVILLLVQIARVVLFHFVSIIARFLFEIVVLLR